MQPSWMPLPPSDRATVRLTVRGILMRIAASVRAGDRCGVGLYRSLLAHATLLPASDAVTDDGHARCRSSHPVVGPCELAAHDDDVAHQVDYGVPLMPAGERVWAW